MMPQHATLGLGAALLALAWLALGCTPQTQAEAPTWLPPTPAGALPSATPTPGPPRPPTRGPATPILTPTPDAPHPLPTLRTQAETYTVQPGDTLALIAQRFGLGVEAVQQANALTNPNLLTVGQTLLIPAPTPQGTAPAFKIIPDSELVNGPYAAGFDVAAVAAAHDGYLARYTETVGDRVLPGPAIVQQVAQDYSVNPRLLLAVLEYQSGWLTQARPDPATLAYPLGLRDPHRAGLWRQLSWAADRLNFGFYLWQVGGLGAFTLADGTYLRANPQVNAGTAAVQTLFAPLYDRAGWEQAVGPQGLFATFQALFGYPFDWAYEPLLPPNLTQPPMQLPFEPGLAWFFTGGPHPAWGNGSAWAALDFAPGDVPPGCTVSGYWATAVADGLVVRSDQGVVVLDLDGDGWENTGWAVLYLHLAAAERVPPGTRVRAGDPLGHPSCEGGISTGTHVHLARKYNGVWMAADGPLPFVLDGWVSQGTGKAYDGFLVRDGERREACQCREPRNTLLRPLP